MTSTFLINWRVRNYKEQEKDRYFFTEIINEMSKPHRSGLPFSDQEHHLWVLWVERWTVWLACEADPYWKKDFQEKEEDLRGQCSYVGPF